MAADAIRVGRRVLLQMIRDPRFLILASVVPGLLIVLLRAVFEGLPAFARLRIPIDAYAVPAAGFFVFFLTYVLASIVLVRERRDGTLERMLAVGYHRGALVLGYVVGYGVLAMVQTGVVIVAVVATFAVDLSETWLPAVATTFVLSLVALALGLVVSALARTEGQIFPSIPLVIVPSFLLCGLIIPLDQLPGWLRAIARVIPVTYAEDVLLGLLRDGRSFEELVGAFLVLIGSGVAFLVVASLTLRAGD